MNALRLLMIIACACALALGTAPSASAEELTPERRAQLEQARDLVDQGLAALEAGRGAEAVDLLQRARSAAPGAPIPAYDHALALARLGQLPDALVAYKDALAQAPDDVRAAVAARARHNLSFLQLDLARGALQMLQTPGALEQAIRAQPGPDGEPLTEAMADTLAMEMRRKLVDEGLTAAKDAVAILRDTVRNLDRSDPSAKDSVRNLILAQRARRALEAELQQQQTEQDEQGEQDDGEDQEGEQGEQGDEGEPDDEGEEEQDPNAGKDDQEQDGQQQSGQDGDSTESDDESAQAKQGEPRDVGREEAERMLERLLDAAALKARQVEEMKAARLRRGSVEKDW